MASRNQLLSLQPFNEEVLIARLGNIPVNTNPHSPPDDILQLQEDVLGVFEGRIDIKTFPEVYQKKIKDYYKFSATVMTSNSEIIAHRTTDTLDIV